MKAIPGKVCNQDHMLVSALSCIWSKVKSAVYTMKGEIMLLVRDQRINSLVTKIQMLEHLYVDTTGCD